MGKQIVENRLKEHRERSRLTQHEVAKVLDIKVSTISRHENGSRGLSRDMVDKYAALYKVSASEIFVRFNDRGNLVEED